MRHRRLSRTEAVVLVIVGLAVGTQLDDCNQFTPHDQPTAPRPDRALVTAVARPRPDAVDTVYA